MERPQGRKEENVLFLDDLIQQIKHKDIDLCRKIIRILDKYIPIDDYEEKCLELESIKNIIDYLSSQNPLNQKELETIPTPEAKLNLRFGKDESLLIQTEYGELCSEYNELLKMAKILYIDTGKAKKIKLHLRSISRECLQQSNNNGKEAFKQLMKRITKPPMYCITAVRFYLISELMECDVFPLTTLESKKITESV